MSVLEFALEYARRGWPVFPCRPDKRPYTPGGFKAATTDEAQIRAWFGAEFPNALVGLPTGRVSGIFVVDMDRKNGVDGWETWRGLELAHAPADDTLTVITPSGGYHYYFRYPDGVSIVKSSAGKLGPGLDIRGDGGYVIAAGSEGYDFEGSSTMDIAEAPRWFLPMVSRALEPPEQAQERPVDRLDVKEAVSNILTGSPLHDSVRGLAAHFAATGVATEAAIQILRGLLDHSRARYDRPDEWKDRRDDVPRLVWSAEQFAPAPDAEPLRIPDRTDLQASESEMLLAALAPRCIVENYLYADVAQLAAPGGTGKTTVILYEAVCVALGRALWGLEVRSPGWTLIVTAEDERERLLARLREICSAMELTPEETAQVRRDVIVWDVSGEQRKLIFAHDGNLMLTDMSDQIVAAHKDEPPAVVIFDPLVSFGAAEERVNDNEQALIMACRRIVRGLKCCVRVIHHTGKANAREKTLDQYSGRGGSALADGTRMTAILQAWDGKAKDLQPPAGIAISKDDAVAVLARPKLSYSPPNLPLIWIKRNGYGFEYVIDVAISPEERQNAKEAQLLQFLRHQTAQGRRWTANELETQLDVLEVSRAMLRQMITAMLKDGRLAEEELPIHEKRGRKTHYLHPAHSAGFSEPAAE